MNIYSLHDYRRIYNKFSVDQTGSKNYEWNAELFAKDVPNTMDDKINTVLVQMAGDVLREVESEFPDVKRIRSIEGAVYITLKNYFGSSDAAKQNDGGVSEYRSKAFDKKNRKYD
jgi:hypothetical protein